MTAINHAPYTQAPEDTAYAGPRPDSLVRTRLTSDCHVLEVDELVDVGATAADGRHRHAHAVAARRGVLDVGQDDSPLGGVLLLQESSRDVSVTVSYWLICACRERMRNYIDICAK